MPLTQVGKKHKVLIETANTDGDETFRVYFDALMDEEEILEATIPQYVTDKGYEISDNIYAHSKELKMTLFISESPVTWRLSESEDGETHVEDVLAKLKNLFFKRMPVNIRTNRNNFLHFGIERLNISKTLETGYSREIGVTFKEIKQTYLDVTDIEHDVDETIDQSMAIEGAALNAQINKYVGEFALSSEEFLRENYPKQVDQIMDARKRYQNGEISQTEYSFILTDIVRDILYAEAENKSWNQVQYEKNPSRTAGAFKINP